MESLSSNLNASLPLNVEEDAELTDRFKESALAITALFKHSQKSRKATFAQGYQACISDLRDYIRSNGTYFSMISCPNIVVITNHRPSSSAEPERPLTVGVILDYLESRQSQLFRDLDIPLGNGGSTNATIPSLPAGGHKARPAKSPSPSSTNGTARPKSPGPKRPSPNLGNASSSPMKIAAWTSPSLSPAPLAEPAWSDLSSLDAPKLPATGWPEISIIPALPIPPNPAFATVLPSVGAKRKRDALAEVDPRNSGNVHTDNHHRRNHGNSKKRKGSTNKGKPPLGLGLNEDWVMDLDDETNGRDRKRPRA
ncbi:hypothetical protein M408DRAFT_17503 [Serendipita vermifera MAFF 305830]|uniref:Uncharacterized protein n=1 Tax=Serendipita vermifera MAFF 305830 TaxID=933852 RepID=A0A0C3AY52_SERVB|nr:hypothetical protein M408DRAFT_17503 [Serendipita vermifera MAFF 305830]